ncbi:MAG: hypothetical protein ACRDO4_18640 [Nocardioides sp.]
MSEPRPARIRVTGPPRRRASVVRPAGTREIDAGTEVGEVYMRSLLREQRRLAIRVLAVLATTVAGLPLLFSAWPPLADQRLLGVPVAWVLLGVLVYPWLLFLGWRFLRRAEQNEADFEELVGEVRQ